MTEFIPEWEPLFVLHGAFLYKETSMGEFECGPACLDAANGLLCIRADIQQCIFVGQWREGSSRRDPDLLARFVEFFNEKNFSCRMRGWVIEEPLMRGAATDRAAGIDEKKLEVPAPTCWFCPSPADLGPACGTHLPLLKLYQERLSAGGMQDTPEERESMHRFVLSWRAEEDLEEAKKVGFRARLDQWAGRYPLIFQPSLEELPPEKRQPAEEIPAVGMTPHFEWP